jgi:diguanylate cyclase (GGDEF)-like protein
MDALCSVLTTATDRRRTHSLELTRELRTAALEGDDPSLVQLLSDLLRVRVQSPAQRRALQLRTLTELIHSLRSVAVTDELTGLYNRRGFFQHGTRLLDVVVRHRYSAHLVYFDLDNLKDVNDTAGHAAGDSLLRAAGAALRELFPGNGVYEIVGRIGGDEFAALTTSAHHASRDALRLALAQPHAGCPAGSPLSLSTGVAHFDPRRPVTMDKLLAVAERAMYVHKRVSRTASTDPAPLAV